jgi:hypothetical protein
MKKLPANHGQSIMRIRFDKREEPAATFLYRLESKRVA